MVVITNMITVKSIPPVVVAAAAAWFTIQEKRSSILNIHVEGGHFGWAINSDNDSLAWDASSGKNGIIEKNKHR